ncbi:MAG: LamG-like jellyroll fold domain-containing protein, partial [Candidatus Thorarchaeota archaeon]
MKKAGAAIAIVFIFLVPLASGPIADYRLPALRESVAEGNDFLPSDWEDANSGNGGPLSGNFNGVKVSGGTSVIDYSQSGYIGIDPPLGWSSEQLEGQLDHLSMWVDNVLVNPNLDVYTVEKWFFTGSDTQYNNDPFFAPESWTIVKNEPSGGSPSEHPQHGYLEVNGRANEGYDATIGWRFDANPSSSTVFDPSNGVYISQQIPSQWREIYSAEITFLYYVASPVTLDDTVYIFTRFEGEVLKHHVFEVGDPTDTWVQVKASFPSSYLQSLNARDSLLLDIGLGTDVSGLPGSGSHEVYIDEIELKLLVRPYPEEIDLRANGALVTGSVQGSVSPYVPDGSNRDCYSAPDSNGGSGGVDLDGYSDFGWLDVGVDGMDWLSAFPYQVGLQFPLNVPQGSSITSAILEIETPSGAVGAPGTRIFVADEDDVSAFTTGYPLLPDLYDWVNTSIYWRPNIPAPGRYNSPDISGLIQEVVARPGWQSGNYICIMIDYAYAASLTSYIQVKGSAGFPQGQLAQLNVDFVSPDSSDVIPSFRYNKNILIDHTRVASDLQDFPVLVDIWDDDLHINTQADGDDIAFLYNGQVIPHDLELFDKKGNGTHAHLVCWVKVPHLSSVEDTSLVMVYGDEDIGSQDDPEDVWESDYSAVWHMGDNPAQPQWDSTYADYLPHQPQILDSTLLNLDGQTYGSMTSSDSITGHFGSAIDLEGANDFVDFGNPAELQMAGAFTVEAWFKVDFVGNDYLVVKSGESNYRGWDLSFDDDPTISPAGWVMFRFSTNGVDMTSVGYERVDTGYWYHVVGVFNPSSYVRFYLNGELAGELTIGVPASVNDPSNRPVRIGRRSDNPGGTSYLDAIVDEVRISNIARSDAWIKTQYNNQKNPQLFMTVGEEGANFRYMKDITIDYTKVESDVTGFPVLIDIYDSDLRTKVQADGDDIAFTSNGRSLTHEIELFDQQYNSTHAHLIVWVKADLSSTADTVLTMYYGNPSIGNQEDPAGVWGINYVGVWHLGETTGDALDSTYLGIDGTVLGGPTRGVSGTVGNGYTFDGSDDYISLAKSYTEVTGTYSFWLYPVGFPPGPNSEVNFMGADAYLNRISYYNTRIRVETATDAEYFDFTSSTIVADAWQHIVFVRSGDTGDLYINGVWIQQDIVSGADTLTVNSIAGTIDLDRMVNGTMDEVRISTGALSSGWILTEYNNQYDPSSFYSLANEQEVNTPKEVPLDFMYIKDITIDHTKVTSDLYGFPVLIDLYDTDLRLDVQPDGDDILFAKDGWILPHEIELFEQSYNSTHGHLIAWVKTDLSSSVDTNITMYYGNPSFENHEDPAALWGHSSVGTWHMGERGNGAADEYWDSSPYYNHGQGGAGIADNVPTIIDGKIGYGQDFDGSDDLISVGNSHTLQPSEITWSAWVRRTSSWTSKRMALFYTKTAWNSPGWYVQIDDVSTGGPSIPRDLLMVVDGNNFFTYNGVPLDTLYALNEWVHLAATFDSTTNAMTLYVNGVAQPLQTFGTPDSITSTSDTKYIPGNSGNYVGSMDEVHVANKVRSPDWILTEYRNQEDPASFITVGSKIELTPMEFQYRKEFNIDHTKVGTDLNDFPMLIDIFDSDLRTKGQSGGDDIFFKNGANILPHEIELFDKTYNSTHAHLVAWVKVDLSSSIDTTISMYYGNPTLGNQEDPDGVWNSNYVAVWHMNQDPSSSVMTDSTSNGYDLTATGFVSDQRIYDGKIGTAISVDGVNNRF